MSWGMQQIGAYQPPSVMTAGAPQYQGGAQQGAYANPNMGAMAAQAPRPGTTFSQNQMTSSLNQMSGGISQYGNSQAGIGGSGGMLGSLGGGQGMAAQGGGWGQSYGGSAGVGQQSLGQSYGATVGGPRYGAGMGMAGSPNMQAMPAPGGFMQQYGMGQIGRRY